jgi:chlorobactene glucosyltransferase
MDLVLLLLPWMALGLFAIAVVRLPRPLPPLPVPAPHLRPSLSVIVPARDEEDNITSCVGSLAASEYPDFEILVVDDQSEDRTAERVESLARGNASEIRVVPGRPRPPGWFGKPWACWQGAGEARGELLLFVDADTIHGPDLMARAVAELFESGADTLTLIGRQLMESFWERLLQPQFFMLLAFRFPRTRTPRKPRQWRHAIANGQYLLFHRKTYDELGGHEAVAGEVVEDMRLAQLLVRGGWTLVIRGADSFQTRMYTSLGDLVQGWGKNIATGALQATHRLLQPVILPLSLLGGTVLWLVPPVVLLWSLLTGNGGLALRWSAAATGFGVAFWGLASGVMKGNPLYGFFFPLGSVISAYIFIRSWARGSRIEWKGRSYEMSMEARKGMDASTPTGGARGPAGPGPVGEGRKGQNR